jgi:hypothetical protein
MMISVIKITNFLDIIHHPKFKIGDILENGISLRSEVKPTLLGPVTRTISAWRQGLASLTGPKRASFTSR